MEELHIFETLWRVGFDERGTYINTGHSKDEAREKMISGMTNLGVEEEEINRVDFCWTKMCDGKYSIMELASSMPAEDFIDFVKYRLYPLEVREEWFGKY